nr:unnamed protein product [Digitaria exilis]
MASSAEAAEMVASAAAAAASEAKRKEGEEKREGAGILGRIWRALFGGRGEDYETRLQNLSKEEAAVLARMRRRAQFSRHGVRNLIALSVLGEKYDLDSAAKAAAASVLASKMGAETGLKVHMGGEAKSDSAQARSNDGEVAALVGLRNRKETKAEGSSYGSTTAAHTQQDTSNEAGNGGMEATPPSKVVGHYQGTGTSDGGWITKIAALLVGEDPSQSYALICGNCHMHNGLARKEDFPHVTYYCPHCHALNLSNQSIGQCSSSDSCQLSPVAPADGVSTTHPITETELSSTIEVQELSEEANAGKQPVEPAN